MRGSRVEVGLEFFEIEGTTLLHWRMTVAARDEGEAVDGVRERVASCLDTETSPIAVSKLENRIVSCKPADLAERPDPLAD